MYKRAIILAGGKGTRLRPYTVVLPKPLMPISEYPILEIIVRQLAKTRFNEITIAVNHQADIIKAYFGDGSKWGININYSLEKIPLSTMGPLRLIKDLPDNFLIMNGDILTDLNFSDLFEYHLERRNIFTISSCKRKHKADFGVLEVNKNNELISFKEKPVVEYSVSMGVYCANKEIIKIIPENVEYGFDDLMIKLIELNKPAEVKRFEGYWLDIGRRDDYMKAIDEFETIRKRVL
jgi:NDP-sugar pyrophosphorylase family protein